MKAKIREITFQFLYSQGFPDSDREALVSVLMHRHCVPKSTIKLARERAEKIFEQREEFDRMVDERATEYAFERIPRVEQSLLRLALFELKEEEIPPKVVLAESVRLAKKFANAEGARFVNAILDAIYQNAKDREGQVS